MRNKDDIIHAEILAKIEEIKQIKGLGLEKFIRSGEYYIFRELVRLGDVKTVKEILNLCSCRLTMIESIDYQVINLACLFNDIRMLSTILQAVDNPVIFQKLVGFAFDIANRLENTNLAEQIQANYAPPFTTQFPYKILRFEAEEEDVAQAEPITTVEIESPAAAPTQEVKITTTEDETVATIDTEEDTSAEIVMPEFSREKSLWASLVGLVDAYGGIERDD